MKITREEFKELVAVSTEVWKKFCEYGDYINENLLDELMFPYRTFIEKALGIDDLCNAGIDILTDATRERGHGVPVEWKTVQVGENEDEYDWCDVVYSKDLDVIYDKYIKETNRNEGE